MSWLGPLFILNLFAGSVVFSQDNTVKTNHQNVGLWNLPGRDSGGRTIGEIERYEEVQLLSSKKLENGETWLLLQKRYYIGDQLRTQTGWAESKFFTNINTPVKDDEPNSTEATVCSSCEEQRQNEASPTRSKVAAEEIMKLTQKASPSTNFIWPVRGTIRSGFGYRIHPIKRIKKFHRGTDIAGNAGASVKAAKGGTIEVSAGGCTTGRKRCNGGAGNMVTIDHGDGTKTRYFHLSPNCKLPRKGTQIPQGAKIGCVGATGAVTGPHLHFEVLKNGKWINPLTVLPRRKN